MSDAVTLRTETGSELRRFWPAVLACFVTAVFGWGFGFTGTSVYLAELQRLHGWPTGTIAGAIMTLACTLAQRTTTGTATYASRGDRKKNMKAAKHPQPST